MSRPRLGPVTERQEHSGECGVGVSCHGPHERSVGHDDVRGPNRERQGDVERVVGGVLDREPDLEGDVVQA